MIKNQIILITLISLNLCCKENQSNDKSCTCPIEFPFGYLESLDSNQINSATEFGSLLSVNPNIKINKYITSEGQLNIKYISRTNLIKENMLKKTLDIRENNKLFDLAVLYQLTCSNYKYKVCNLKDSSAFEQDFNYYNKIIKNIIEKKISTPIKPKLINKNNNCFVEFNDYTSQYIKEKIENEFVSNNRQINIKINIPLPQTRYDSNQFYFNGGFIKVYVDDIFCFQIKQKLNALNSGSQEELKNHISRESNEILISNYQTIIDNLHKCIN